jgi:hypothetical protein
MVVQTNVVPASPFREREKDGSYPGRLASFSRSALLALDDSTLIFARKPRYVFVGARVD